MAFDGLRFIHACNLYLDHALAGIASVSEKLRPICEDATLTAFDQILAECIERQVHFLLLTGNLFDPTDLSLRARLQLLEGLSLLEQHDIRVFIVPGTVDPSEAWDDSISLPDNVTAFLANDCDPVAVLKDRRVIASVRVIGSGGIELDRIEQQSTRGNPSHPGVEAGSGQSRSAPYSIAVLDSRTSAEFVAANRPANHEPVGDYLALSGDSLRLTRLTSHGLAHHPGPSQGLTTAQTGLCSCTLVDVDSNGSAELTILPTASVRRERCQLPVSAETTQDELLDRILDELTRQKTEENERAWYVEWMIDGCGPLMSWLADESALSEFADLVAIEVTERFPLPRQDVFLLQPHEETAPLKQMAPNLLQRFPTAASELPAREDLIDAGQELIAAGLLDHSTLETLISGLDLEEVAGQARVLGATWLVDEGQ